MVWAVLLSGCPGELAQRSETARAAEAGVTPAPGGPLAGSTVFLSVGSFNIANLGPSKISDPGRMELLARIAREFDVLVVLEVSDVGERAADSLLAWVNRVGEPVYAMYESPRVGRGGEAEQYAVLYRTDRVDSLDGGVVAGPGRWAREPLFARLWVGRSDFSMIGMHTKPARTPQELAALAVLADTVVAQYGDSDVVLLGDLNADCQYFRPVHREGHPLLDRRFVWLIGDDDDTNVALSSCAYDRIIVTEGLVDEVVRDSARVVRFDSLLGLPLDEAKRLSDHYPVRAVLRLRR